MAGFDNEVMYADNVDFSGGTPVTGKVTLNGQILIGSTIAPNIRVATLTPAPGSGITITNGPGSISIGFNGTDINPPIGALQYFSIGGTDTTYMAPNWLNCDGSTLSQGAYPTLFSRLGLLNNGGSVWTARTTNAPISSLIAFYANSLFVAASAAPTKIPTIFTSTDAITWTGHASGTNTVISALTYGNGTYVYVGNLGCLGYSTDGSIWNVKNPIMGAGAGQAGAGPGMIFANSIFVAGGVDGLLYTSTDGVTFSARLNADITSVATIRSLTYGTKYVQSQDGGLINTSTDGITWTSQTSGTSSSINCLAYGNSAYVFAGGLGLISSSTDAVTWTARTSGTSSTIYALTYGGGLFVYGGVGAVGTALGTSTDGTTWTARSSAPAATVLSVAYGSSATNPYIIGCNSGSIRSSTDAITWTARTSNTSSAVYCLAYNGSVFVYGTAGGGIGSSTDGITWVARTSNTSSSILCMTNNGTTFYGGGNGFQMSSTDGTTWTVNTSYSGTLSNINALSFGNNLFTYGGAGGVLATSVDGKTWTSRTSNTSSSINALTYGANYVFAANGGVVSSSTDAITWTTRTSQTTSSVLSLTYGNSIYVYGAASGGMAKSTDAITWTAISSGTTTNINALTYANGIYVGTGGTDTSSSQILTSTDLVTWGQQNPFTGMRGGISLSTGSGLFILGGGLGTLGTSPIDYPYNTATQFQLPTYNTSFAGDFVEVTSNFKRSIYIKALT